MTEKASILIVDDRPEKVLSLEVVLEGLGQEIVRAYSGREALRQVLSREFAVILLDVNMPGLDGFETAAMIRQRKHSEHVPIIFVTAFGDEMHAARGYSLGAVDYILAPVIPEVLRSKVGVFVDLFLKTQQMKQQAESLRRRATQLQKLAAASVSVNTAASIERMLQTITDTARDIIGCEQAITLFLGDPRAVGPSARPVGASRVAMASYSERLATWRGKPPMIDAVAKTLVAQSRTAVRMSSAELRLHPDWEIVKQLDVPPVDHGLLTAPLLGRDGTHLGVIRLADRVDGEFTADDEAVLVQLAQMGAITIENSLYAHEREANRLKDEFLATLSHELRTPLNAIFGWTQLLQGEEVNDEVGRGLTVIERNVLAQSKLVDDLLDVSRITTGKFRVTRQTVQLAAVVEAAVESVRPVAAEKRIHVHAVISPVRPLDGDPDRLQQVVWNLLSNAVKFTPANGRVTVSLDEVDPGDDDNGLGAAEAPYVEVRVTDNGAGIDPQFLPYVFDRFRQADASSTRKHGGLGIGLTIVRHIVELHGGSVHASSAGPGTGSAFVVRLPLACRAAPGGPDGEADNDEGSNTARIADRKPASPDFANLALARRATDAAADRAGLHGLRIVVVEDEPDSRHLLEQVLSRAGAVVHAAADAGEAMTKLRQHEVDVLVSDIAMPGEDGYSLIRRVRALDSGNAVIPAVAVTAYAREEDRARALGAGFQAHVAKPVSPELLLNVVAGIVARSEQAARLG